jgi:hypothetical protein
LWRNFGVTFDYFSPAGDQAGTATVYVNGNEITSSAYQANSFMPIGPYGLCINSGSLYSPINPIIVLENSICEIGDILVYNRVLTNDEIQVVSSYLESRVGL